MNEVNQMHGYKVINANVVYVGPFGVAPYTHPGWQINALLPEMKGVSFTHEVMADSALGNVFFRNKVDKFSVNASQTRLVVETEDVRSETLAILSRIPERIAMAVPTAMCVGIGFNLSYRLTSDAKLVENVLPEDFFGAGRMISCTRIIALDGGTNLNLSVCRDSVGWRIDFNYDFRLATPTSESAPVLAAKTWSATTSFQCRMASSEEILRKMVVVSDTEDSHVCPQ